MEWMRRLDAFTLVELLTVIAIIGLLAAILLPTTRLVMGKARISVARSDIAGLEQAILSYVTTYGAPPPDTNDPLARYGTLSGVYDAEVFNDMARRTSASSGSSPGNSPRTTPTQRLPVFLGFLTTRTGARPIPTPPPRSTPAPHTPARSRSPERSAKITTRMDSMRWWTRGDAPTSIARGPDAPLTALPAREATAPESPSPEA